MSRAKRIIDRFYEDNSFPIDPDEIKKAFEKRFDVLDIEDIFISGVDVDFEGDIVVSFADIEDNELSILFTVDPDEGAEAIVVDDDDEENDSVLSVDLDPLTPVIRKTPFGDYIDLTNIGWINKSTLLSLVKVGDFDVEENPKIKKSIDAFGHTIFTPVESYEISEQGFAIRVRGGKKVRLPVVRRRRKKRLTSKQKAGIRKAVLKRKQKKGAISRKRKKSLKVRKRLGVKKGSLRKTQKVRG